MPAIEEAERALELADEAFARFDVEAVVAHLSAAIRGFTAAGDNRRAADGVRAARRRLSPTSSATSPPAGPGSPGPAASSPTSRRASSRAGSRSPAMGCDVDDPADAARGRGAGPRPGAPLRRRQPRDEGARRRRARPRPGRARRRGHGAARRGDGAGLRPGRRRRRSPPSRCARSSPRATTPADFERAERVGRPARAATG